MLLYGLITGFVSALAKSEFHEQTRGMGCQKPPISDEYDFSATAVSQ